MKSQRTRNSRKRHSSARTSKKHKDSRLIYGVGGPCDRLAECQACTLLPLSPHDQLQQKLYDLREQVARFPNVISLEKSTIQVDAYVSSTKGYRYTAKPSVRRGARGDQIAIGLYQPGSHQLVDLRQCWIQSPLINQLLEALRQEAPHVGIRGYEAGDETSEHQDESVLRYVVVRQGLNLKTKDDTSDDDESVLYLTLIVTTFHQDHIERLIARLTRRCSALIGVGIHQNTMSGNAIFNFSEPTQHVWGAQSLSVRVSLTDQDPDPLYLQISAKSFAQVNPQVAERAYRAMVNGLQPRAGERALDLYCAVGVIGLMLAEAARRDGGPLEVLWGLEETPSSIADAKINAQALNITEARFICGRAEDELPRLTQTLAQDLNQASSLGSIAKQASPQAGAAVDTDHSLIVALNPSRRGCQPQVIEAITDLKPRRIAYMSCHARTLTRDLARFFERGYQVIEMTLFDMFPGSPHYETVALLEPISVTPVT